MRLTEAQLLPEGAMERLEDLRIRKGFTIQQMTEYLGLAYGSTYSLLKSGTKKLYITTIKNLPPDEKEYVRGGVALNSDYYRLKPEQQRLINEQISQLAKGIG